MHFLVNIVRTCLQTREWASPCAQKVTEIARMLGPMSSNLLCSWHQGLVSAPILHGPLFIALGRNIHAMHVTISTADLEGIFWFWSPRSGWNSGSCKCLIFCDVTPLIALTTGRLGTRAWDLETQFSLEYQNVDLQDVGFFWDNLYSWIPPTQILLIACPSQVRLLLGHLIVAALQYCHWAPLGRAAVFFAFSRDDWLAAL